MFIAAIFMNTCSSEIVSAHCFRFANYEFLEQKNCKSDFISKTVLLAVTCYSFSLHTSVVAYGI